MTLDVTERTSAHGLEAHIRGKRIAASDVLADRDILVQIFNREREEGNFIVPAVAEPLLVWIISGNAAVQERELGGQWETSEVAKGDFFLTTSAQPYEMRWNVSSADDFEVMHIYLGVPLLEKALHEVLGGPVEAVRLREVSGGRDEGLSVLLEHVRLELMGRGASPLYLQGLAQCIAVYLARNYLDSSADDRPRRNALPAYKFRRVLAAMEADLAKDFNLRQLAEVAGMSDCHFSRMFKSRRIFTLAVLHQVEDGSGPAASPRDRSEHHRCRPGGWVLQSQPFLTGVQTRGGRNAHAIPPIGEHDAV